MKIKVIKQKHKVVTTPEKIIWVCCETGKILFEFNKKRNAS